MGRYGKYFLEHMLWLEDSFCPYYVQSDFWGRPEILDVESVIFNYRGDAAYWMVHYFYKSIRVKGRLDPMINDSTIVSSSTDTINLGG